MRLSTDPLFALPCSQTRSKNVAGNRASAVPKINNLADCLGLSQKRRFWKGSRSKRFSSRVIRSPGGMDQPQRSQSNCGGIRAQSAESTSSVPRRFAGQSGSRVTSRTYWLYVQLALDLGLEAPREQPHWVGVFGVGLFGSPCFPIEEFLSK